MGRMLKTTLLYLLLLNTCLASERGFVLVPFKQSMNVTGDVKNKQFKEFEDIYEKRNPDVFKPAGWPLVPKKIHQIWLYHSAIPLGISQNIALWREMYPDWEYKLWLLEDVNDLDFSTRDLYRKAKKITEKLDLIKFEILNKFGGVYVDINCVPTRNISFLSNYYKFYAGLDPLDGNEEVSVSAAFIASSQDNLLLHKTLQAIREEWHKKQYYKEFTKSMFNKVIKSSITEYPRAIIFPTSYFGITLLDHPLISFISRYVLFQDNQFFNHIHRETIVVKQKY